MATFIVLFVEEDENVVIRKVVDVESKDPEKAPAEAAMKAVIEYHQDEYDDVCEDFSQYAILAVYKEKHDKTDFISEDTFSIINPLYVDDYEF